MYEGAKTRVRTVGGDSEHFSVVMGLHQGSALNPFLFALAIDTSTCHIQREVSWCMLFANDIVLIDETYCGVNERLEVCTQTLESKGLKLSTIKTRYVERKFSGATQEEDEGVRLKSQPIPKRESFKSVCLLLPLPFMSRGSPGNSLSAFKSRGKVREWLSPYGIKDVRSGPHLRFYMCGEVVADAEEVVCSSSAEAENTLQEHTRRCDVL
uniref:Reverse transcriptase domain-containing protein n=1 Tax=Nicotiana tabacum TaxID=4097 RepID=A0A1S3WZL5_TOBAC|nr:PREDICTED: uncharacterized protein LOC107759539 [Nicotiana tabacum]